MLQRGESFLRAIIDPAIRDFRRTWPQLLITDIVYKLLAFLILTPLAAVMLRTFLSLSGTSVLADEDILFFFLKPLGWVTLIVLGGVLIAIVALEQAGLMTIALGARRPTTSGSTTCKRSSTPPVEPSPSFA